MQGESDGARVAASLARWLAGVTFTELTDGEVTDLLVGAVVAWAEGQGWRAYRRAPSVVTLPPPYEHRHSVIDVGCARPGGAPIAVELDRTDRRRTVEKLLAEAEAGRVAIWLRWGAGPFAEPPPPVHLVTCPVTVRRGSPSRYTRQPARERPAPRHTAATVRAVEQVDLFGGDR